MSGRTRRLGLALPLTLVAIVLAPPGTTLAAECEGDECQGPPPAPAEIVPGTMVVEGPQNPPVHFPKAPHPKKPHHKKAAAKGHHKPPPDRGGRR